MNKQRHKNRGGHTWFVLLLSCLLFTACAQAPLSRRDRELETPEAREAMRRFDEAERLAEKKDYLEAYAIYEAYLRDYPTGVLADNALMNSGLMLMAVGKYEDARNAFETFLRRFPKSAFAQEARFNIVLAYYTEGSYTLAAAFGESSLKKAKTREQKYQLHNLLGYIYGAGGEYRKAFDSYMQAYARSDDNTRAEVLSKVKEVIAYLSEDVLIELIDRYGKKKPGGYLHLQLAQGYASEDLVEQSIETLEAFIKHFPNHEEMVTAEGMVKELESRTRVDRFLVGCILPLSGRYATFGNRALAGIELALSEMNARLDMQPVQLRIRDSKGEPGEAVAAVEELVLEQGVVAIIGPMVTSESAASRAEMLRVPMIALTQKPDVTTIGDYVFRNFLTLSSQVKALVEYTVRDLGIQRFAIFYPEEPYGVNFMNQFWDELLRQGADVVGVESYRPDQTDFRDAIKKLVGLYYPRMEKPGQSLDHGTAIWEKLLEMQRREIEGFWFNQWDEASDTTAQEKEIWLEDDVPEPIIDFEAIFIPDSFDKIGLIAPQLIYHDVVDTLLLGTNLWHSDKLLEIAQGYVQGAIIPDGFFLDSPLEEVAKFVDNYTSVFGESPDYLAAQAYDVARVLAYAINDPSVRSRRTLMQTLKAFDPFPGVTGSFTFDETGDSEKELYLLTIEGNRFLQIKP